MAELRNCKKCNRIFSYFVGQPICPQCKKEEETLFEEVSRYVRDHPGLPLAMVAKEMDVSYDKLLKYVREGRLQVKGQDGKVVYFCEHCGEEIPSGRLCKECEDVVSKDLASSKQALMDKIEKGTTSREKNSAGGFRFLKER